MGAGARRSGAPAGTARAPEEAIVAELSEGEIDERELAAHKLHEQAQALPTEEALAELKRKMKDKT